MLPWLCAASDRRACARKYRVKERELLIARLADLPWNLSLVSQKLSGNVILLDADRVHHASAAGNKVEGALQDDADFFQVRKVQAAAFSGGDDAAGGDVADARHAQKRLIRGAVDLHRELLEVPERPVALRVQVYVKVGACLAQQLIRAEMVVAQQPVRLIEPVLPEQGGCAGRGGEHPVSRFKAKRS